MALLNVVASLGSGYVSRMLVVGSDLYAGTNTGLLLKWDNVSTWIIVVASGSGAVDGLIYFNSKIYSLQGSNLYEFDDVSAWVLKGSGISNLLSLGASLNKIYAGNLFGNLYEWDGVSAWSDKTGLHISYSVVSIHYVSNKIICFTWGSVGPTLQEFTGSGWSEVAPSFYATGTRHFSDLLSNNKIQTASQFSPPDTNSRQWNDVNAWVLNGNGIAGVQQKGWAYINTYLYSIAQEGFEYWFLQLVEGTWIKLESTSTNQLYPNTLIEFNEKLYMSSGINLLEFVPPSIPPYISQKDKFANQGDVLIGL